MQKAKGEHLGESGLPGLTLISYTSELVYDGRGLDPQQGHATDRSFVLTITLVAGRNNETTSLRKPRCRASGNARF
jgi:hypothetical protein